MLRFFKDASIHTLKTKLTWLYVLNAMDIVFTFALVETGMFFEANKIMVPIIGNAFLGILLKLLLPALLIIYILSQINQLPDQNLKVCNICINIVCSIYVAINLLHVFYSLFYVFQPFFL